MAGVMSEQVSTDVVIIGGGVFGCLSAIEIAKKGFSVVLLEKNTDLMLAATLNNQNRLHLGYHYPRDVETAIQCQRGFDDFYKSYKNCILDGFDNAYFISALDSKVDFVEYAAFCDRASLPFRELNLADFCEPVLNVEGGILTGEVVYDSKLLRAEVLEELLKNNVEVRCNHNVDRVLEISSGFAVFCDGKQLTARAIVNCTYANFSSFNKDLGLAVTNLQYELTVVPVVRWRKGMPPIGITVMDGPFFTVLPFGKTGSYLLYHVEHTVLQTVVGESYPNEWSQPKNIVGEAEARKVFEAMVESSSKWLPSIKNAEFVNYLATVRVVFANSEETDRRPSVIEKQQTSAPFYSVFSGKIDHSIWVSQDVAQHIERDLGEPAFNGTQ
ncbi:FAD-dependent oxidoreductase [Thalassospira sp. MCCC 1A01148]|uniref:FAD dependent oxidoreductase domain-containing protein n=2 Tax=Thalassospira profundimaris TaxID=502049 RepID=A0A367V2F1_9PROT|nr:FAD-dependent oxidoreductase [Thalassospira sp. MCCC 1A01148]KZB69563.1 hypothetical protein AUQ43_16100 [Thalassospira sp. MCCC 1A01148]RCK19199.1 hypothetical protein TH6_19920 [Thalassospira profundimaris]